jgi:DNA-binding transcriptional MocR family regulator
MKKYQQLAQQLTEQIALGVWQPGDRLPSLREQVVSSGMSFMTVSHAYQLLESQGRIIARRSPATTWRQNRSDSPAATACAGDP